MELLASHRLPSVSDETDFAKRGGLLSLGLDYSAIGRAPPQYIDRILQGAKVPSCRSCCPRSSSSTVNLKTAQQLGITIPPSILLRADEVIE